MDAFIDLFDPLPIAALFAIFIAAGLAFIFGLEALVHRWLRSETRERVSTSTSVMIQVLAVFYSVLIAFVIVGSGAPSAKPTTTSRPRRARCRRCSTTSAGSRRMFASRCARPSSPTTGRC
jgi:predicted alpha/beta hydrolase